jgi:hypothetical protein
MLLTNHSFCGLRTLLCDISYTIIFADISLWNKISENIKQDCAIFIESLRGYDVSVQESPRKTYEFRLNTKLAVLKAMTIGLIHEASSSFGYRRVVILDYFVTSNPTDTYLKG